MMDYSKALKEYRGKCLLTQTELAEKLGVSYASINRWENKKFEPTMKIKRKLRIIFEEEGVGGYVKKK